MKKQYEAPFMEINWFESTDIIAYSETTDYIPETDSDDAFGDL